MEIWQPIATKPPQTACEERGHYRFDNGTGWRFVATHWRPFPAEAKPDDLRRILSDHWLAGIRCDHEAGTDTPSCACSLWKAPTYNSVGAAVQGWIDHVIAQLPGGLATDEAPPR